MKFVGKIFTLNPDFNKKIAHCDENVENPNIRVLTLDDDCLAFLHCGFWEVKTEKFVTILYKEKIYKTWVSKGSEEKAFVEL